MLPSYQPLLTRLTAALGFPPPLDIAEIIFAELSEQESSLVVTDGDLLARFEEINRWFDL
jgi:hypothetical protein